MRKLLHEDILLQRLTVGQAKIANRNPISLIVHNVRSLYNIGSLFRTCDSMLAEEIILCGYTPHPPRKEIEKTALGAVDTVPWRYEKNIQNAITQQKSMQKRIIALELTDTSRNYDSLQIEDYPLCLIIGNELTGIDDDILAVCDSSIEIPMSGVKHSLNVSVAAGIALYEAVRIYKTLNIE